MDDSLLVPTSSSDGERWPLGMRSLRMWIWIEFVSGKEAAAGREFESLLGIMVEVDFGAVTEVGSLFGLEYNFEFEVGGEAEFGDMKKTETWAGAEAESVILWETVWCPKSLSGHLERWCFETGHDLLLHCQNRPEVVEWMKGESLLKMT